MNHNVTYPALHPFLSQNCMGISEAHFMLMFYVSMNLNLKKYDSSPTPELLTDGTENVVGRALTADIFETVSVSYCT